MHLTQFTDYSLRVMLYLGSKDGKATAQEMADHFVISRNHLAKVVNRLGRLGYLRTLKGKNGGVQLSRSPTLIRMGDLVQETEPPIFLAECFNPRISKCTLAETCGLKSVLVGAKIKFIDHLNDFTLADLVATNRRKDT